MWRIAFVSSTFRCVELLKISPLASYCRCCDQICQVFCGLSDVFSSPISIASCDSCSLVFIALGHRLLSTPWRRKGCPRDSLFIQRRATDSSSHTTSRIEIVASYCGGVSISRRCPSLFQIFVQLNGFFEHPQTVLEQLLPRGTCGNALEVGGMLVTFPNGTGMIRDILLYG